MDREIITAEEFARDSQIIDAYKIGQNHNRIAVRGYCCSQEILASLITNKIPQLNGDK